MEGSYSALLPRGVAAGFFMLLAMTVVPAEGFAHQAPSGWTYPYACCSGQDCREVRDTAIGERPEGYVIKATGEVVGYEDRRIKYSPDGHYHWCSVAGSDTSRTICLFVPPRSF